MQPGVPLTWHRDGQAVKVYKVPGTMQGSNTFDLNDWLTGTGGTWEDWSVQQGLFSTAPGDPATDCLSTSVDALGPERPLLGFDRHSGEYVLSASPGIHGAWLRDVLGRELPVAMAFTADGLRFTPAAGLQLLTVHTHEGSFTWKLMAP
jgi:hypothetical protein